MRQINVFLRYIQWQNPHLYFFFTFGYNFFSSALYKINENKIKKMQPRSHVVNRLAFIVDGEFEMQKYAVFY